jgi:hypothetical protein
VAVASGPLLLLDADVPAGAVGDRHSHGIAADVAFVDVLAVDDRVHVLARSEEGALLLSFDRSAARTADAGGRSQPRSDDAGGTGGTVVRMACATLATTPMHSR